MIRAKARGRTSLESRTIEAHRAYVQALVEWERVFHLGTCSVCRPEGLTDEEHGIQCELAEAQKERRRMTFRERCDELGYMPSGAKTSLPLHTSCGAVPRRRKN
ncbi:hypothetical protein [Methylocystis echinoides]|uniref:Uncharacterized protein n=1 Tax=Methylocystis echinoides TaxID=29468 RepID=A0A9W6GZX2_9HYPH|nr:hypothetical protein [Methylocystis echinoides]GLI96001.1 hypothetical protein LMG27198_49930 [Methylocystis echinoides]